MSTWTTNALDLDGNHLLHPHEYETKMEARTWCREKAKDRDYFREHAESDVFPDEIDKLVLLKDGEIHSEYQPLWPRNSELKLGVGGIRIRLGPRQLDGSFAGGEIFSTLKAYYPPDEVYNAAVDAVESLVLAHAVAGVDVEALEYAEGLETCLDALANNI